MLQASFSHCFIVILILIFSTASCLLYLHTAQSTGCSNHGPHTHTAAFSHCLCACLSCTFHRVQGAPTRGLTPTPLYFPTASAPALAAHCTEYRCSHHGPHTHTAVICRCLCTCSICALLRVQGAPLRSLTLTPLLISHSHHMSLTTTPQCFPTHTT